MENKISIFEAISKRYIYRLKFQEKPIADDHLKKMLEAFRWGPSQDLFLS